MRETAMYWFNEDTQVCTHTNTSENKSQRGSQGQTLCGDKQLHNGCHCNRDQLSARNPINLLSAEIMGLKKRG